MAALTPARVLAALLFLAPVQPALAQDVALRSFDGSVEIEGNLLGFDGAYYRVDTRFGPLTVAAEGVTCAGPGCPDLTRFVAEARIAGAVTVAEGLLPAMLSGFAEARGMTLDVMTDAEGLRIYGLKRADGGLAARFMVEAGSTDDGFLALLNGETDLALALREPSEAERRAARAQAPDDPALSRRVRVIGLDAMVPVVSAENPVDTVTLSDLAAIFAGEIENWSALGGPDAPIAAHLLNPGLGLAQAFETRVILRGGTEPLSEMEVTRHDSAAALAQAVARDAYAIGVTVQSVQGAAVPVALSGPCGFRQTATRDAVKSEDYPLTAPVYMYLAPRRLPHLVRQFLEYAETPEAETVIAAAGFVDQGLTRTPLGRQGTRLANAVANAGAGSGVALADLQALVARMTGTERLSATFRFAEGAIALDPPSRAAATRLAAALERGAFDGRRLIFAGFSDSAGSAAVNQRLSLRRAEAARDAVLSAAAATRSETDAVGFGEIMPLACDDTPWGRAVNRRVEVWVE